MSRQFDDYFDRFPLDLEESYYTEHYGVAYRPIKGWDHYYISSDGEVISCQKGSPRVLETWTNQYGHKYTRLNENGRKRTISIHRTVAEHFVNNPRNDSVVRHLDDDPENNCYRNLAWGTQADNVHDMRSHGRMFTKPLECIETGRIFNSCAELADELNVSRSTVSQSFKRSGGRLKGKHYRYLNEGKKHGRNN